MGSLTPRDLPLGLRLEHGAGHTAFLAADDLQIGDLVAVERLRLALPGVWTAHNTTVARLATTRPALTSLHATVSESALNAHLAAALESAEVTAALARTPHLAGLRAVIVKLYPGHATLLIWRSLPTGDALTTCRLFVGATPQGTLQIDLFEPRGYGEVGLVPPACLVRDVLATLFGLPGVVGRVADEVADVEDPSAISPRVHRDRVALRPIELLLAELLTGLGWKLPVRTPSLVCRFTLEDGCLALDARDLSLDRTGSADIERTGAPPRLRTERAELDQARRVMRNADTAMFAGQLDPALDLLRALRQRLGHHPSLLARLGALLLVRATPAHLEELTRLCAEALRQQPDLLVARLLDAQARSIMGTAAAAEAAHAMRALLGYFDEGSATLDRIAVLLAVARLERDHAPARAVTALREAMRLDPTLAAPLEALDDCYRRQGAHAARLEILQRLTGLTRQRPRRARLQLRLAEVLHELGVAERALAALHAAAELVEPDDVAALGELAECAARIGEATVAIELFGRVADLAEARADAPTVARACLRSAELWLEAGAPVNARLACHSALAADPTCVAATRLLVQTSLHAGDVDSAAATLDELIGRLEHALWTHRDEADARREALVEACRMRATLATERGDEPAARAALRRLLLHAPGDDEAFETLRAVLPAAECIDLLHGRLDARLAAGARAEASALMLELASRYERDLGLPGDALAWIDRALELDPGSLILQRRRVALLEASGHHGDDLRAALEQMVARVVEPAARASLLVRIARIELDSLGDIEAACENLHRAVALCPTDTAILLELRRALSRAGRVPELVAVLERLARLTDAPRSRRDFLVEAGDAMNDRLGRPHQARRLYRQALSLGSDPAIERRLAQLELDTHAVAPGPWHRPPTPPATMSPPASAPPPATGPPTDVGPIVDDAAVVAGPANGPDAPTSEGADPLPTPISAELDVRFASADAAPFDAAASFFGLGEDDDSADDSALPDAFAAPDPHEAPDWREAARQWSRPSMPAAVTAPAAASPAAPGSAAAPTATPAEIDAAIEQARRGQDPARLADLLEQALAHELDTARRARLHQELGCVVYYDLDDAERARDHLELASQADPDGVGLEAETLTALEGIYEDLEEPAELAAVWERRLQRPGSADMAVVYRLLAAQLYHEQLADDDAARRHLDAVLDEVPDHEPALRLRIEIERQAGHAALAAELLERLVAHLGDDREAVAALLPELADQYALDQRIDDARRCLQRAVRLTDPPRVPLERLKRLCRAHDDWHGLLDALVGEAALQLDHDEATSGIEALMELDAASVPAASAVGLCQILREIADILSFKLDADEQAWRLYGRILALVPEDAYALERRIELSRLLGRWHELAVDLTRLASMLLDPALQLDALADAAALYRDRLGDRLRARELLAEAVALFAHDDGRQRPARLEDVERDLAHLEATVVVRVSLGTGLHAVPPPASPTPARDEPDSDLLEIDLDFDLADDAGTDARLAELEAALATDLDRVARVELLVEKGRLSGQRPDGHASGVLALREALALAPDHLGARLALIDALLVSGEVEQALNHLVVLAQQPVPIDSPAIHDELIELAEAIVATGRPGIAQRARSLLDRLDPPSSP